MFLYVCDSFILRTYVYTVYCSCMYVECVFMFSGVYVCSCARETECTGVVLVYAFVSVRLHILIRTCTPLSIPLRCDQMCSEM